MKTRQVQAVGGKIRPLRVMIIQNSSGPDCKRNLDRIEGLLPRAGACDLLAFAETFALRGSHADYRAAAQSRHGPILGRVAGWAVALRTWILAGSFPEAAGRRIFNSSAIVDPGGRVAAVYRKIHLFEAFLGDKHIREANLYQPGNKPVTADINGWRVGMSVCYDLRFPELYRIYASRGASVLLVPSSFTRVTGEAHWEVLLRARAIENQSFVVAPGLCGTNPESGVESYGNSMMLDPWGNLLARAGTAEGVISANLQPALLVDVRRRVPALRDRAISDGRVSRGS